MGIKIKDLRAKRATECSAVLIDRRSTKKDLVRRWNDSQKEYRAATQLTQFRGKLVSQAVLIAFLDVELATGTRSRSAIAKDAGISKQVLAYYIKKGKVRLFNATVG